MKHTPTPWNLSTDNFGELWLESESNAIARFGTPDEDEEANAAFIVKACNNHERLVKVLECIADSGLLNDSGGDESGGHLIAEARAILKEVNP